MTAATILIVDDEPSIRRLLRTSLASQGFQVKEAADGHSALTEIERAPPDLVILDLGLPDIDGLGVIRALRDNGNAVPILVLSSRSDEKGKVDALDLGADDYVTKRSARRSCSRASAPRCAIDCNNRASRRCSAAATSKSIWSAASCACAARK